MHLQGRGRSLPTRRKAREPQIRIGRHRTPAGHDLVDAARRNADAARLFVMVVGDFDIEVRGMAAL
jgi:hypothetical protein